ncbi:LRRK2 [Mytilus coruscus]|uniref:LRRK2 n=1 Tax=Mytilus coruscus TaxID=42192 RepID=A0A6J8C2M8_MYTCO|nr:LRRK2 [Mytilus coruscus]
MEFLNLVEANASLHRGRISLGDLKKNLEKPGYVSSKLEFCKNAYSNDAALYLVQSGKTKLFTTLTDLHLQGCNQITNAGIKWLTKVLEGTKKCKSIYLDGCHQLTDDDLALLLTAVPSITLFSLTGVSIRHLSHPAEKTFLINGCPVLTGGEKLVDLNHSHAIVVPQRHLAGCFVEFFKTKKTLQKLSTGQIQSFNQVMDFPIKDWKVTLTEILLDHPMFDVMISSHPVQVIITFDTSKGDLDGIKKHIVDTIARVVTKAAFTTVYPKNKEPEVKKEEVENDETKLKVEGEVAEETENTEEEKKTVEALAIKKPEEKKPEAVKEIDEKPEVVRHFRECEFLLIQIGKPSELIEELQQFISGDILKTKLELLDKSIEYHEQHFSDLDMLGQNAYASLCAAKEKLETFNTQKNDRIHFMSVDMDSEECLNGVYDKMTEVLDCRKHHQEIRYKIAEKFEKYLSVVLETVKKNEIIDISSGLTENLDISGAEFLSIAKLLQEQGKVVILQLCSKTLIIDLAFLKSMVDNAGKQISSTSTSQNYSTAIKNQGRALTLDRASKHFGCTLKEDDEKSTLLLKILQDYCGLVELPVWRLKPEDQQFIYVVQDKLEKLSVSLETFYSEKKPSNFVVMEKSYKFIYPVAKEVLSGVVSSAAKYGRTIFVTAEGAVFQIGCVQTVVKTLNWSGDNREIVVQSKCYLPDLKTEPVNDETEFYVKEYTWNIFCLYTDMIDKVLKQRDIIYLESGDVPNGFVHNSFGCKHLWKKIDSMFNQSVCSMCNRCCGHGRECKYNGIMGDNFRECLCKTSLPGCVDCGICTDCAADLWELRSYLRPQPFCNNRRVVQSPSTYWESVLNKVPLDPLAYNEVEMIYNTDGRHGVFLREAEDGAVVSVFPGKATALASADQVTSGKIVEKFKTLIKDVEDPLYLCNYGDSIKIRISDPSRIITKDTGGELDLTGIKESKVVYQPIICRDLKVSHETGLLCYDPRSSSLPVAQFIGAECFSENLKKFSYKIIHEGKSRYIGIGVAPRDYVPNRMPGWNSTSYGYHADDGGIYTEKSSSNTKFARCYKGDIMSVYCDTEAKDIKFYKNDKLIYKVPEESINVPTHGFFPMVALHSAGECVKLLEKEPWTLRSHHTVSISGKWSYDAYKYGNMWISPTKNLSMTPKDKTDFLTGWVILHNPTKGLIGYQINPGVLIESTEIGSLGPNESLPFQMKRNTPEDEEVEIEWIAIDKIKDYSIDDIKQLFTEAHENRKYSHKLKLIKEGKASSTETLPTFSETEDIDGYKLDVIKNSTLVNSYVLKKGRYCIEVAKIDGKDEYLMKRPKCPSFMYPPILKRGMKVITCVKVEESETMRYEEKVISRVQDDGKIEYLLSNDDDEDEESLGQSECTLLTDQAYKDLQTLRKEKKEAGNVVMYSGTKEQHRLEKTLYQHLLS